MSCVHYKFSSKLDYNTVTFDGMHITLNELKRQIMARERLKATECDLQITNAQTREGKLSADMTKNEFGIHHVDELLPRCHGKTFILISICMFEIMYSTMNVHT